MSAANASGGSNGSLGVLQFGRIEVIGAERSLRVEGRPVPLGSRAFDLLTALVERRDRVVTKDELIDLVWPGLVVEENNLQVQISALRKALGAQAIATVPGRGYRFTVAEAPGERPRTEPVALSPTALPPQGARLLVADDNKVNRLLLCRTLSLLGHAVRGVDSGRAAIDALRAGEVDLLLLDLEMPEVDGFELLSQRAKEPAWQRVPVIVTSSVEGAAPVARCIELGADDFLHKPVDPMLLKARVDSSLERKRHRDRERELLARMAPEMAELAQSAGGARGGQRVQASVLVARVMDTESTADSQDWLELLGIWTALMVDAIEEHGGLLHEWSGDGLAAVFGAPAPLSSEGGAPWAAARAGLEMVELLAQFNAERQAAGRPPLVMAVGLSSGEVLAGYAGTALRRAFVCVGPAARQASRLAEVSAASGVAIVIDVPTQLAVSGRAATKALAAATQTGGATSDSAYRLGRA